MNNEKSALLRRTLLEISLSEFEDIPEEESLHHEFSSVFEKKMAALTRKSRNGYWSVSKIRLRRTLLIAAAIIALLLSACAAPVIRQFFIEFTLEDNGLGYVFAYDEEKVKAAPERIETAYAPKYVPGGFELKDANCTGASVVYIWYNEVGQFISFDQMPLPDDSLDDNSFGLDAEKTSVQWVTLGGEQVLYAQNEWAKGLYWASAEYRFVLCWSKDLSDNKMIRVFKSIAVDNTAQIE